jgi:prepilin peptidase CpaA
MMSLPWLPLVVVLVAAAFDLRSREVPDWVALVLLGWAVVATGFRLHPVGWLALLAGLGAGLGLSVALFALGGLGGGDVKLTAALGAALGLWDLLAVLLCTGLAGGVLALVALLRGKRDLAYVPAFALGFLMFLAWRGGLAHVFTPAPAR